MAPKLRQDDSLVRLFAISNGDYSPSIQEQKPIILLRGSGKGDDAVSRWASLAQKLFPLGCRSIFVLDIVKLMADLPKEMATTTGAGPVVKPLLRMLQKFNPQDATVVGLANTCALLAKLVQMEAVEGLVSRVIAIEPDNGSLRDLRLPSDAPPAPEVAFHFIHVNKVNVAEETFWRNTNKGEVTSAVAATTAGTTLMEAIASRIADHVEACQAFEELPQPDCPAVKACELVYTLSHQTKHHEVAVRGVPITVAQASTTAPAAAAAKPQPAKPAAVAAAAADDDAAAPSLVAAAPKVTAPTFYDVAVPEWWEEDRDSHISSVRPGAVVANLMGRVVGLQGKWAKIADQSGTVRVQWSAAAHDAAFKVGSPVCVSGKVLTDQEGRVYVSVPPGEATAAEEAGEDELTVLVGDKAETAEQLREATGLNSGEVRNRVGCLLLRGSKVALTRRKDRRNRTELCVPSSVPEEDETPEATAMRCLADALDVDVEEFRIVPHLGTLTRFPEPGVVETLFFAFATSAPPGGAKKDTTDIAVDPTSPYDWFTLRHALRAASYEWHSVLWEAARRMRGAYAAQVVLPQWKCGLFGVREVEEEEAGAQPSVAEGMKAMAASLLEMAGRVEEEGA